MSTLDRRALSTLDRRDFLKYSGVAAGAAAASVGWSLSSAAATAGFAAPSSPWRKAFMLGGRLRPGTVRERFATLREAGFDGVEILAPSEAPRDEILQARDETGIVIHGVCGARHWQEPLSDPDPDVVARGMAAFRQAIADCQAFGGDTVLVVPAVVGPRVSYRDAYARSQARIRELLPIAEAHKVRLAIENVWNKFLLSAPEFARYVDEFQSPWAVAYFDVGNVVEYGYPQEWIRELGRRIAKVHIKEYAKKERFSYKLGDGQEIDWAEVRGALKDIGYTGWITAEVPAGDLDNLKDVARRMDQLLGTA